MSLLDLNVSAQWNERKRRLNNMKDSKSLTLITNVAEQQQIRKTYLRTSYTQIGNVVESSGITADVAESSGVKQQQTMDEKLWEAAKNGDIDDFITCLEKFYEDNNTDLSAIFSQLTDVDQDTFLHVAASYGHEDLTGFIAVNFIELLSCRNHRGNSALHLAARAGHYKVVVMLLWAQQEKESKEIQVDDPLGLIAVNDEGNTALHEAMLNEHKDVALCLIESNLEEAYYVNKQGKSPLYMAVESSNVEHVKIIFHGRTANVQFQDEQLKQGSSLVHAAIRVKSIAILQQIFDSKPWLIEVKDKDGRGPLAYALSIEFIDGVTFLEDWSKKVEDKNEQQTRLQDIIRGELRKKEEEKFHTQKLFKKGYISPEGRPQLGWDENMSLELYECAKNGDPRSFDDRLATENFPPSVIYNVKTPLQNTFLHVAASFGNVVLAKSIADTYPSFLNMKNHRGDTALHVAAAAGHLNVVKFLLNADTESNNHTVIGKFKERVQVNNDGNTPLHEALMNNHGHVAEYLIKEKVEYAYYVNKQEKSALYMAIEANKIKYVDSILNTRLPDAYQRILYEEVTKGKSLLRAAIKSGNSDVLQGLENMTPPIITYKNEDGQTALHYAASSNSVEWVRYILKRHHNEIIKKDNYGFLPIHCASKYGYVDVLEELLKNCLDAREFVNEDGQNILHVAAKYGKYGVVRYILKSPGLTLLLNGKDKNGNTPLHLAAKYSNPKVVSCLTWDKRIDLKHVNDKGLTALDVAEESTKGINSYRPRLTWMALKSAGARRAKPKSQKLKSENIEQWKDRVNTLLLVSILIATVTFAAAFTMPGGYSNSKQDQGLATLRDKPAFQVFTICDAIAMYIAILVSVILIWAQIGVVTLAINSYKLAMSLLAISLTMMCSAFLAAVYVVVSKLVWLSYVVLILGVLFIVFLLTLFFTFIPPHSSGNLILHYLNYFTFFILMLASGNYFEHDVEHDLEDNSLHLPKTQ